ncbi:ComF family protein [Primorskyibacter sp. S87]|uniref:ComF family protein n=1 Tax=Primorskyibacter sp. S87 TaxID=3415126 RepID=UPI003C79D545
MWSGIQTAVELIYPPRCLGCGDLVISDFGLCGECWREAPFISGTVCESCGTPLPGQPDSFRLECDECMKSPRPWADGRSALLYSGQARKMVLALKHGDRMELARPAARWMAAAGKSLLSDNMLTAPVPLHWSRLLKRRYNQSALLARAFARETGLVCCPDLLVRTRRTPILDGLTAAERTETLRSVIEAHPKRRHRMEGRDILLVDDVMTSGATLTACTETCLAGGAKQVFVLTLARVVKND